MSRTDLPFSLTAAHPPSLLALKLIERFNRMAAENTRFKALEQQSGATQ